MNDEVSGRLRWRVVLGAVLIAIALATLSPSGLALDNTRVSPFCITCPPTWLADAISNVVLFVPLGVALCGAGFTQRRARAFATLLSLGIEVAQFVGYPAGRDASFTDWCANSLGGVLGVLAFAKWRTLWLPSLSMARRLWPIAVFGAPLVLAASAWAIAPNGPRSRSGMTLQASPLPHTPGHGWFGGVSTHVLINGQLIAHRGTGPIIRQTIRPDELRIDVTARGRDEGVATVPIVWLHAANDSRAMVMLAQRDRDAVLRTQVNATSIGLATPQLRHPNAFPADPHDSSTLTQVLAEIFDGYLLVHSGPVGRFTSWTFLSLSPALGWGLIQTVVGVDSRFAPWLSGLWVAMWFAPIGWWCAAAMRTRHASLALLATAVSSIAVLSLVTYATMWWRVSPISIGQGLLAILASLACAVAYIAWSPAERSHRP